ncbi:hypothetical protein [Paraburkholderia hospita]|uniref:hypothetical protein n=1 Tax=Paraburkholderia hospita TaxID=169430 RepID=UPI0008A79760|nr:hypothetical protein [Paraburkholderia hospita]SEH89304.1 hypothetical protein SAMN05192544_1011114 [Paraburkholderia hospita]
MKASEHLLNIGRPVAFYPGLVKYLGSVNAVLFFGQIFYWQDKAASDLGVYKSVEEIEDETGLTYREQQTARKQLVERGVLIETHRRLEHRIYYRIDAAKIDELMDPTPRNAESADGEPANDAPGNSPNAESAVGGVRNPQAVNSTETTTETTNNIGAPDPKPSDEEQFSEAWAAYPKRAGGNSKADALKAWNARRKDKIEPERMIEGVKRYAKFCDATEKTGTEYVKQAATFFGPGLHFDMDWTPPPKVTPRGGRPSMNAIQTDPAGDDDGDLFDGKHFRKGKPQ